MALFSSVQPNDVSFIFTLTVVLRLCGVFDFVYFGYLRNEDRAECLKNKTDALLSLDFHKIHSRMKS